MSIPKNHHYVSQCHQKEFFNSETGRIYVYDKERNNYYHKQSTKRLFSESFLNTKESKNEFDHSSLEFELKALFEDDFMANLNIVKSFIQFQDDTQSGYEALCWLAFIGIIGELRHPSYKKSIDEIMLRLETDIVSMSTGIEPSKAKSVLGKRSKAPYNNVLGFIESALKILEKMEPIDFVIYSIESGDHFLLPDTSSFHKRGQLKNYPNNLIREMIQIGVPVSDKLFILATPKALNTELHGNLLHPR